MASESKEYEHLKKMNPTHVIKIMLLIIDALNKKPVLPRLM